MQVREHSSRQTVRFLQAQNKFTRAGAHIKKQIKEEGKAQNGGECHPLSHRCLPAKKTHGASPETSERSPTSVKDRHSSSRCVSYPLPQMLNSAHRQVGDVKEGCVSQAPKPTLKSTYREKKHATSRQTRVLVRSHCLP